MDIIMVQGTGRISKTPNKVGLNFEFRRLDSSYEKSLAMGVKDVEIYIDTLIKLGFKKEALKTRAFRVSENRVYDEKTRTYESKGFIFNQSARIEFDYDIKLMSKIMEETSKLKNPPTYTIVFGLKEDKKLEEKLFKLAYEDAEFQAKAIAKACGKTSHFNCKKISFEPLDDRYVSSSRYETDGVLAKCASARDSIEKVFVPEDVELEKTLYCLFDVE